MGQSQQKLYRAQEVAKDLVFRPCVPPKNLEFNSQESCVLSVTINEQGVAHSLTGSHDTEQCGVARWFQEAVSLPPENVHIYAASKRRDHCTLEGIKGSFKRSANSVGTNGIFIFHFTGHAVCVGSGKWALVPTDYVVRGSNPVITSTDIVEWLRQSVFQGRYCLFVLDVCSAEGIADDIITQSVDQQIPVGGLFIMSSRTANASSVIVPVLGMTFFSYFFSFLTLQKFAEPGKIHLCDLYECCNVYCMAFSSLILSYDPVSGTLSMDTRKPDYKQYHLPSYLQSLYGEPPDEESTDSGRFLMLCKHFNFSQKRIDIPDKCLAWLEVVSNSNDGPLYELNQMGVLHGPMITAAIAAMTYSMALNMSCLDKLSPSQISSRNAFIITFLHVTSALEKHVASVGDITCSDVRVVIDCYAKALGVHEISTKDIMRLKMLIQQTETMATVEETIDSGPSNERKDIIDDHEETESDSPINLWVPLKSLDQD